MATNTQQFVTVIKNKKVIFNLGITEVVLGMTSIVLGSVLCRKSGCSNGEGIWCGIWFIVAGSLGMAAGGESAGVRIINLHMGFSIWGSVAAGSMTCVSGWRAAAFFPVALEYPYSSDILEIVVPTFAVSAVVGFIAFILLIVSAAYCCCSTPYNCCSCCCAQSFPAQPPVMQNVYTLQTFTSPGNPAATYPPQYSVQANQPAHVTPGKYGPFYNEA